MATTTVGSSVCNYRTQVHTESASNRPTPSFPTRTPLPLLLFLLLSPPLQPEAANKLSYACASPLATTTLPLHRIQLLLFPFKVPNDIFTDNLSSQVSVWFFHSVENKNENNHNLFSVPVIYNEYMLLSCTDNAELQNVDFSQGVKSLEKRKRSRPWKNENVNFGNNELVEREQIERITILCDDVKGQNKKERGDGDGEQEWSGGGFQDGGGEQDGVLKAVLVCRGNKTVLVDDNVAINEQGRNHGGCPVIPFLNEQMHLVENNITGSPKCTIREEESEGGLLTISGNEQSFDLKGNVIKVTNGTINVVNHNEVLCHKNNEFGSEIDLSDYGMCDSTLEKLRQGRSSGNRPSNNEQFHDDENSDKCTKQDADIVTCTVQESCFLFVGNQHTLTAKDNATGSFNGTMDELKQNMDYVETVLSLSSVAPVQSVEKNLDTAFTGVNSRGAKGKKTQKILRRKIWSMIVVATLDQMKVSDLSLCGEIMKKMTCYVLILHVNQFKHQAFFLCMMQFQTRVKVNSLAPHMVFYQVLKG
ncbi:DNA-binding family protein [Salix suchowensis]|nr:DNA-binding family protein [Salix suchowensis]